MGAWFVRYSPSGRRLAAGDEHVVVYEPTGAEVAVGPGTTPVWLDEETVLYTRQPDGACLAWPGDRVIHAQGFNALAACAGRWAGWRAAEDILVRSWAEALPGARMPQLGRESFAHVLPAGNAWRLLRDGQVLHQAALRDLRMSPDGVLCWSQHVGGVWETWGARPGHGPERLHLASGQELWPVPLDSPEGPWVLSHTDHALLLRPWGRDMGYQVHVGVTDFPDAVWTPEGWRVAWSARGVLDRRLITHDTPRVVLVDTAPAPPPQPVDPKPEDDPVSTPQHIIDLLVSIADAVDARYPGLRATDLPRWMGIVAWRAHQADRRIGRKRGSATRPISNDTVGYLLPEAGAGRFSAISICRDNPGQNERRYPPLDYQLVGPEQVWSVPELVIEETPGPTPPPLEPPPTTSDLEARVAALERWRVELGAYVVRTATGWPR